MPPFSLARPAAVLTKRPRQSRRSHLIFLYLEVSITPMFNVIRLDGVGLLFRPPTAIPTVTTHLSREHPPQEWVSRTGEVRGCNMCSHRCLDPPPPCKGERRETGGPSLNVLSYMYAQGHLSTSPLLLSSKSALEPGQPLSCFSSTVVLAHHRPSRSTRRCVLWRGSSLGHSSSLLT